MINKLKFSFLLIPILIGLGISSSCDAAEIGVVEGFYWEETDSYKSRYGDFSHEERRKLIQFMSKKGLNAYAYDPKVKTADRMSRHDRAFEFPQGESLHEWKRTFELAKAEGVSFIWGISPGNPTDWKNNPAKRESIRATIEKALEAGASSVSIQMDDVPNNASESALIAEVELLNDLYNEFGHRIKGFCPGRYFGEPTELLKNLSYLDKTLHRDIPFILTGLKIWNRSITGDDLPSFPSGRSIVLWDNWMASDSSQLNRLTVIPPTDRDASLFNKITGYWLNVVFPVDRIIPAVSGLSFFAKNGRSATWGDEMTQLQDESSLDWAEWMSAPSSLTNAFLSIKFNHPDLAVQPDIDEIFRTLDQGSLKKLLDAGLDPNEYLTPYGSTLIQLAEVRGDYRGAQILKEKGADDIHINWNELKRTYESKMEDLRWETVGSLDSRNLSQLDLLLKLGASLETENSNGKTLIQMAEAYGDYPIARYLQARGANDSNINWRKLKKRFKKPPILKNHSELLRWEIVNCVDSRQFTRLKKLLDLGISVETKNSNEVSLIRMAEYNRDYLMARFLIAYYEVSKLRYPDIDWRMLKAQPLK